MASRNDSSDRRPLSAENFMTARCGLCLQTNELRDSHLMPAALYKLCRTEGRKNPHPVVTTRKAVFISSDQVSARFLCATCEDRFSRNGERHVLSQCARRGGVFKLRKHLESAQPVEAREQFRVYAASSVPEVRVGQFLYF